MSGLTPTNHRPSLTLSSVTSSPLLSEDTPDFLFFFGNISSSSNSVTTYNTNNFCCSQRNHLTRNINEYNIDTQFKYATQRSSKTIVGETIQKKNRTDEPDLISCSFKMMQKLRKVILLGEAFINKAYAKFFDEFVYNVMYSKLLEERLMISNYNGLKFTDPSTTHTGCNNKQRKNVYFDKYNIQRLTGDTFFIELSSKSDTRYLGNLITMIHLIKAITNNPDQPERNVLALKLINVLIYMKNHTINRGIYSKLLLKSCLTIFKCQFIELNVSLDIVYKKSILKFKEIEIHNDPIKKLNPCLINQKNIIQYLCESVKLQINHLILNLPRLLILLRNSVNEKYNKTTLSSHIMNYCQTNKIVLNNVITIIYDFYYNSVIRNSTTMDILSDDLNTSKLKPMKLPVRTGSMASPKLRLSFTENIESGKYPDIDPANTNEGNQFTYKLLDGYLNDFHLIRKFYLIMWIIVLNVTINGNNSEYTCKDDPTVGNHPDLIISSNIVEILTMINLHHESFKNNDIFKYGGEQHSISKLYIIRQLQSMLLLDCRFFNTLKDQVQEYFQTNNLSSMLVMKAFRNTNHDKKDINKQAEKNTDVDKPLARAKQDVIERLNFICYNITKSEDLEDIRDVITSINDLAANNSLSRHLGNNIASDSIAKGKIQRSSSISYPNSVIKDDNLTSLNSGSLLSFPPGSPSSMTGSVIRLTDSKPLSVITRDLDSFYNNILSKSYPNTVKSPMSSSSSSAVASPSFKPGLQLSVLKVGPEIEKGDTQKQKRRVSDKIEMNMGLPTNIFTNNDENEDLQDENIVKYSRKDLEKALSNRIELMFSNKETDRIN